MQILFSGIAGLIDEMRTGLATLFLVWFIVLPPIFWFTFHFLWRKYVWRKFLSKQTWVLLEIISPRDVEKGPLPMEAIFATLAGAEKSFNVAEEYILGELPVRFSLEIASTEGAVHMYIRTLTGFRDIVEATLYAHYPGVELTEVPDYVTTVPATLPNKDWDIWGADFILAKSNLYPIKTYKFFEESVTGKMVDPLANIIEVMGRLGPGQHLWLQYIVAPLTPKTADALRPTIDEFLGRVKEEESLLANFFAEVRDIVGNLGNALMGRELTFTAGGKEEKKDEQPVEFRLTPGEKDVLKALQTNVGKLMYSTRMRFAYIGRREVFSKARGVSSFIGGIKQFNDENLNSFMPEAMSKTQAYYIFQKKRLRYRQRRLFRRYITRDTDPDSTRFMLSTEELATVFHIPDMQVVAPSLTRVAARRSGAPANLPIQEPE